MYIFHVIWLLLVCFKTSTDYIKIKSKIAFNSNMVPNQKKVPQNCVKVHYCPPADVSAGLHRASDSV